MTAGHDSIVYAPADSTVALAPQRVISVERMELARQYRKTRKAQKQTLRLVGEMDTDRRIIVTQEESIRRWAALHARAEARLRRWQAAWGVTIVLALGYVLVYTQIGH